MSMTFWKDISSAPMDGTRVLLLTADFGAVEGYWDGDVAGFYASQAGWACHDPANLKGDWVSDIKSGMDRRLYCGETPTHWAELPTMKPARVHDYQAARDHKQQQDRKRQSRVRRDKGMDMRADWLARNSLSQDRPWELMGISRTTFYRHGYHTDPQFKNMDG